MYITDYKFVRINENIVAMKTKYGTTICFLNLPVNESVPNQNSK